MEEGRRVGGKGGRDGLSTQSSIAIMQGDKEVEGEGAAATNTIK